MPIWLEGHPETYQKAVMKSLKQDFLIVPKPSNNNLDSEWSLHFPFAEKMILRNTKCAKPVIKLLKVKYNTHWEELLQSVSDLTFSKHCGYTPMGVRGVKRSEI